MTADTRLQSRLRYERWSICCRAVVVQGPYLPYCPACYTAVI
jgi:hypothetical protein